MSDLLLRDVTEADLPAFFEHQLDAEARRMAAFTSTDPADEAAFMARWERILADDTAVNKTVLVDGRIAGHVASFERDGIREVTYWIAREFWGQGIATDALTRLLKMYELQRPVRARVAADNLASVRVLEKCGFQLSERGSAYANDRGGKIEELTLLLE